MCYPFEPYFTWDILKNADRHFVLHATGGKERSDRARAIDNLALNDAGVVGVNLKVSAVLCHIILRELGSQEVSDVVPGTVQHIFAVGRQHGVAIPTVDQVIRGCDTDDLLARLSDSRVGTVPIKQDPERLERDRLARAPGLVDADPAARLEPFLLRDPMKVGLEQNIGCCRRRRPAF